MVYNCSYQRQYKKGTHVDSDTDIIVDTFAASKHDVPTLSDCIEFAVENECGTFADFIDAIRIYPKFFYEFMRDERSPSCYEFMRDYFASIERASIIDSNDRLRMQIAAIADDIIENA